MGTLSCGTDVHSGGPAWCRSGVAATPIPSLSMIERMSVQRAPVTAFAPHSAAARAFRALWSELSKPA